MWFLHSISSINFYNIIVKTQSKFRSFSILQITTEKSWVQSILREKVHRKKEIEETDPHRTLSEQVCACIPIDQCTLKVGATTVITNMADPWCASCVLTQIRRHIAEADAWPVINNGKTKDPWICKLKSWRIKKMGLIEIRKSVKWSI